MKYVTKRILYGLLAATCMSGLVRTDVFAAEEHALETIEGTITNVQTGLDSNTVTLEVSAGRENSAVVPVVSYDVDEMTIPLDLIAQGKLEETIVDNRGNEVEVTTKVVYGEDGNIIGYTVTSAFSEEAGKDQIKTTRTEESWQLTDDVNYLVSAELSEVEAGENHDNEFLDTVIPTLFEDYLSGVKRKSYNDDVMLQYLNYGGLDGLDDDVFNEYEFQYVGIDVRSSVLLNNAGSTYRHFVQQFQLADQDGNLIPVYCADMSTEDVLYTGYNRQNVEDAVYYDADAAEHIKMIAAKGYWGTAEGFGSLSTVKQMLQENAVLSEEELAALTPGLAMAATQGAIWHYGNSTDLQLVDEENPATMYYTNSYRTPSGTYRRDLLLDDVQISALKKMMMFLIEMEPEEEAAKITQENFASRAAIVLKSQDDAGQFVTDIAFELDRKTNEEDDLLLVVRDESGALVAKARIAGAVNEGEVLTTSAVTETGIQYILENIVLGDGMRLVMNLLGSQSLGTSAYLYSAENYTDSQTFVGLAKRAKDVDLSVTLDFHVTEPSVQIQHDLSTLVEWLPKELIEEMADSEAAGNQGVDEKTSETELSEESVLEGKLDEEAEQPEDKGEDKGNDMAEDKAEDKADDNTKSGVQVPTAYESNLDWMLVLAVVSLAAWMKLKALKQNH